MNLLEELPALTDDLTGLIAQLRRMTMGINLAESPTKQRVLLLSYSAFYSNFRSCLTLLKARQLSSAPLLLRPVLEACADIVNIANIEGYTDRLHKSLDLQQVKYLTGLSGLKKKPDFVDGDLKKFNELCKGNRAKALSKKEKFVLAGMEDSYIAIFSMMSGFVHNDYNFTLSKCPDMYCEFIDLHETQSRVYDMIFAYVSFMYEALVTSTEALVKVIQDIDQNVYEQFKAASRQLKDRLGLIALMYQELPVAPE